MKEYRFDFAFLEDGWAPDVHISISESGDITDVHTGSKHAGPVRVPGYAIPGVPNSHSHAFQRALSGMTEFGAGKGDNFWSWRERMYALSGLVNPEQMYHIATQLYMEMLKAGYTTVAEFHYLHHQPDGTHYENRAEMALTLKQAAADTGIALTLLPVLYMASGFDSQPLSARQSRFYHSVEGFCHLMDALRAEFSGSNQHRLGCAFHSLRAVPPDAMQAALACMEDDREAPLHIHVSEQLKEIEDCLSWSGQRPVEWLLKQLDIDSRWCLVHATHMNASETESLARTGAVVSLCPTTEANLGDGVFPLEHYLGHGGRVAIGSDSNTSISPVEELRWLEYVQRLFTKKRNVVVENEQASCGRTLLQRALDGGKRACAQNIGSIETGYRADILVLDPESEHLAGKPVEHVLDSFVFSGNQNLVKDVMVSGNWVVRDRQHPGQDHISDTYKKTIRDLYQKLV